MYVYAAVALALLVNFNYVCGRREEANIICRSGGGCEGEDQIEAVHD
jgi:hypothetical protein